MNNLLMSDLVWAVDYESVRRILELVSFLGTGVVGALGFFVFFQIKMAKASLDTARATLEIMNDDMQTRIRREAVVLAVEQTRLFGENVIPVIGKEFDACKDKGIEFDPWKILNTSFDRSSFENLDAADRWLDTMAKAGKYPIFVKVLNDHEAFAMYFVGGAADELLAFPSLAAVYCSNILRLAPLLVALRVGVDKKTNERLPSGPYQNAIKLFEIWSARQEKESLESQRAQITARTEGIHITDIPVLGTKNRK